MLRRSEDRIGKLCDWVIDNPDAPELTKVIQELRATLHEHAEVLRERLLMFSTHPDRRRHSAID